MGIFTKLFSKSINKAASRQVKRAVSKLAATHSHTGNFFSVFGGHGGGASKYIGGMPESRVGAYLSHARVRREARQAIFDSPQAKSIVSRFIDLSIGTGLKLESIPVASILGISPEEAQAWGNDVEKKFDLFCRSKKQHRSGTMNLYQGQRFYEKTKQRDGDFFARHYYSNDKKLLSRLQFEFIDPDQIRGDTITTVQAFHIQKDGIIRNKQGVETGYQIWSQDPSDPSKFDKVDIPAVGSKSGRIMMTHSYVADYAGQGRGLSPLAGILQELRKLKDFELAHILKTIFQTTIAGVVEPSTEADSSMPFEDQMDSSASAGSLSEETQPTGSTTEAPEGLCSVQHADLHEPGSVVMQNLKAGEKFNEFSKAPVDNYAPFTDAYMTEASSSVNLPEELRKMKFGNSYSASRAVLLMFRDIAQIEQQECATDFMNPIYEMWLAEEIAAGRISAPGFSDPRLRMAWLNNTWVGPALLDIDPQRSAKAIETKLRMSLTTVEREAKQLNGSSGTANIANNAKVFPTLPLLSWEVQRQSNRGNR